MSDSLNGSDSALLRGCVPSGLLGRDAAQLGRAGRARKERLAGSSRFRPNRLGKIENPLSFSNLFSKFQTNLNFNDFYTHTKIQEHFITQRKICNSMNATNNYLFKYIILSFR
jgi:hypothetical protein